MRGEPLSPCLGYKICQISTHSPRAGRTRTCNGVHNKKIPISTHSPRAGRTRQTDGHARPYRHFNSLAPCGANLTQSSRTGAIQSFQLTRPVRGEPLPPLTTGRHFEISTHSPRAGRTFLQGCKVDRVSHFNSLAPCGANRVGTERLRPCRHFNSLAPCGANRHLNAKSAMN